MKLTTPIPSPWTHVGGTRVSHIPNPKYPGSDIEVCHVSDTLNLEDRKTVAELIAAAPEMLKLIKEIGEHIEWRKQIQQGYDTTGNEFKSKIDDLINKIEGAE